MKIRPLLQAIVNETKINVQYLGDSEFTVNHSEMKFKNDILILNDGTKLKVFDARDLLYDLRTKGILPLNKNEINEILKTFHYLENNY